MDASVEDQRNAQRQTPSRRRQPNPICISFLSRESCLCLWSDLSDPGSCF